MSESSIDKIGKQVYSAELARAQKLDSTFARSKTWEYLKPEEVIYTKPFDQPEFDNPHKGLVRTVKKSKEGLPVLRAALEVTRTTNEARVLSWIVRRLAKKSKYVTSFAQVARCVELDPHAARTIMGRLDGSGFIKMYHAHRRKFAPATVRIEAGEEFYEVADARKRVIYVTKWAHEICKHNPNESLLLSQLCWLSSRRGGCRRDGVHWIMNSLKQLEAHTGLSKSTIRTTLARLQKKGFVKTGMYPVALGFGGGKPVLHISVNTEVLDELVPTCPNDRSDSNAIT